MLPPVVATRGARPGGPSRGNEGAEGGVEVDVGVGLVVLAMPNAAYGTSTAANAYQKARKRTATLVMLRAKSVQRHAGSCVSFSKARRGR